MKEADKIKSKYVIVIGENELSSGKAKIKKMESGEEFEISLNDVNDITKIIKE